MKQRLIRFTSVPRWPVLVALLPLLGCDMAPPSAPAPAPAPPPVVVVETSAPPTAPSVPVTLASAAAGGDLTRVEQLVGSGASVAERDAEQMTALHHAALSGHAEVIRFLALHQADVEARDVYGYTPLHSAARNGHLAAVQALAGAGADLRALDQQHLTAFDIATIMQHGEIADFLMLQGGGPVEEPVVAEPPPVVLLTGDTFRVWTSFSGAQLEGEFVSSEFEVVQLRKRDSTLVRIRLNQLQPDGQALIRQLAGQTPPRLVRAQGASAGVSADNSLGLRIGKDKDWVVLTDCRLVKRDGNDGDSFHVRHEGKEYIFRLYYADCAETSLAYPDRVKDQAEYFKLNEEDTVQVGLEAKKFTEKVLSATPFTVVTKWEDARGNSKLPRNYAFVVTPQGDLDELLAAEGLVRIYGMKISDSLGERKRDRLKELEESARAEKVGAWGMEKLAEAAP